MIGKGVKDELRKAQKQQERKKEGGGGGGGGGGGREKGERERERESQTSKQTKTISTEKTGLCCRRKITGYGKSCRSPLSTHLYRKVPSIAPPPPPPLCTNFGQKWAYTRYLSTNIFFIAMET